MTISFDDLCTATARARFDLDQWLKQFDVQDPASIEDQSGRQGVVEGLTAVLTELTIALNDYVDGGAG